jgi:hypothetical protein
VLTVVTTSGKDNGQRITTFKHVCPTRSRKRSQAHEGPLKDRIVIFRSKSSTNAELHVPTAERLALSKFIPATDDANITTTENSIKTHHLEFPSFLLCCVLGLCRSRPLGHFLSFPLFFHSLFWPSRKRGRLGCNIEHLKKKLLPRASSPTHRPHHLPPINQLRFHIPAIRFRNAQYILIIRQATLSLSPRTHLPHRIYLSLLGFT